MFGCVRRQWTRSRIDDAMIDNIPVCNSGISSLSDIEIESVEGVPGSVHPELVEGTSHTELPHFLKRGYPDIGLPPTKSHPGALHFPEISPPREPCGQDRASTAEWDQREWARLVDARLIGGN